MNMQALSDALSGVSVDKVDEILKRRSENIQTGKAEIPKFEYDTNIMVRTLHPVSQSAVVAEIIEQEGARTYRLEPDNTEGTERLAPFIAGQYISIFLKIGESVLTRPYAISSAPSEALPSGSSKGFYTITIKKVSDGFATDYIFDNWKVGQKVQFSSPEGTFYYEPLRDAKQVIGIAGGSGITPLYSMAQAIRDGNENFDMTLLYGCRNEKEILFKEELDKIAAECPAFKVIYVLSDETRDSYEHGFIGKELIEKYAGSGDYSLFVCGPKAMYSFVAGEVEKLGLPRRRVRYEAAGEYKDIEAEKGFPQSAAGKEFNITVDLPEGRRVIKGKSSESILVALERAGIKTESRCRSGECGFCRMRVKSGEYFAPQSAEHRKGADIKNNFIHACSAFPVSDLHILLNYDRGEVVRKVKDMKQKERKVSIIMAIIISAIMGVMFALLARKQAEAGNPQALSSMPPLPVMLITSLVESIVVGVIVALVLPIGKLGRGLAAKFNATPGSMKFTLLNSLPFAVINAIIVSAVCSFISIAQSHAHMPPDVAPPLMAMWFGQWIKTLPLSIIVSYVFAVIISPFVVQAVGLGGPPTGGDQPRE